MTDRSHQEDERVQDVESAGTEKPEATQTREDLVKSVARGAREVERVTGAEERMVQAAAAAAAELGGGDRAAAIAAAAIEETRRLGEETLESLSEIGGRLSRNELRELPPLTKEEIQEQFTSEHLSRLSLGEYIALLRRVPASFLTHVTRQGVRDKGSHHYGGVGEVHRGFEGILEKGALRSNLDMTQEVTEEGVRKVLTQMGIPGKFPDRQEARDRLHQFLNFAGIGNGFSEMTDKAALHMAMGEVANEYYGGEIGNDIFFVYPTAYGASQFELAGQTFVPPKFEWKPGAAQYNDLWVKDKVSIGTHLPLDAGLVFIQGEARVDPRTGSQYEIQDGKAVPNTEQIQALFDFAASMTQEEWEPVRKAIYDALELAKEIQRIESPSLEEQQGRSRFYLDDIKDKLQAKKEELARIRAQAIEPFLERARHSGATDSRFPSVLRGSSESSASVEATISLFDSIIGDGWRLDDQSDYRRTDIKDKIMRMGLGHKLASGPTISSRDFWEDYFSRTGTRPSKVIYYSEAMPNDALKAFREKHDLSETAHGDIDLKKMFQENIRTRPEIDQELAAAKKAFGDVGYRIIEEVYPS